LPLLVSRLTCQHTLNKLQVLKLNSRLIKAGIKPNLLNTAGSVDVQSLQPNNNWQ